MTAPKDILRLVDKFQQNLDSYKSGKYNEAQLRSEFLDPFFKALGWDLDNLQGLAEAYSDSGFLSSLYEWIELCYSH